MDFYACASLRALACLNGTPQGVSPAHNLRGAQGERGDSPAYE